MSKIVPILSPTLWRTCRVLANGTRLNCLKVVLDRLEICVEDVAEMVGVTDNEASKSLRALQSRGLISSRRESRWVIYFPSTNPLVESAKPLLDAVSKALHDEQVSMIDIEKACTAYTHMRRIVITRLLSSSGPLDISGIKKATGYSFQAIKRHLVKLVDRRTVSEEDGVYTLCKSKDPLSKALLRIVLKY